MKLRYMGIKPYIVLAEIRSEKQKARINTGEVFECSPETASKLLKWNKQYSKPIFEEANNAPLAERQEAEVDLLGDVQPGNNKMKTPSKRK